MSMTPAERLTAASDLLDKRAAAATPGKWKLWGMSVLADIDGTSNVDTALPVANTSHEAGLRTFNANYIALTYPEVGKALAKALRTDAKRIVDSTLVQPFYKGNPDLVALADLLLAGAS